MHPRSRWHTSTRNARLPKNWNQLRNQTRRAAHGKCQATSHAPGCNRTGTQCDHITPGDNHHPDNLQWLSAECHAAKTRADNRTARQTQAAIRKKPAEKHPGAIN